MTDPSSGVGHGRAYVALGSSFAAGPGIPPVADRGARRSSRNYPHQVAAALSLRLTDVSFSGATTEHVLGVRQRRLWTRVPPQIKAVMPDTALVTVTVGGNDIGYIGGLIGASAAATIARRAGRLSPALAGRIRRRAALAADADQVRAATEAMTAVAVAVRRRAPDARVLFVDYLTVVGRDALEADQPSPLLPLTRDQLAQVGRTADLLAEAFATAAARGGAELVAASAASADHGVLSPRPWVTGFEGRFLTPGARVPYHPTLAGMTAVADLIVEHLRAG